MLTTNQHVIAYGINHHHADITERERLAIPSPQAVINRLQTLKQQKSIREALLLSTCNRTELYTVVEDADNLIDPWKMLLSSGEAIIPANYRYQNEQAVGHLMRVTSGLDSMVLGETQIVNQVKNAYRLAEEAGTIGKEFTQLFPHALSASKQIRETLGIGQHALSLATVTVQLAEQVLGKLNNKVVLLVGAGETAEMMAKALNKCRVKKLLVANRDPIRAAGLAKRYQGEALPLAKLSTGLQLADAVITAVSSAEPILHQAQIKRYALTPKRRILFVADLGVPRNVATNVSDCEDVFLYNLDDLQQVIARHHDKRCQVAKQAELTIAEKVKHYIAKRRIAKASPLIERFRQDAHVLRDNVLSEALANYHQGQDVEMIMQRLALDLTNKLLHPSTTLIRQAAERQDEELLKQFRQLVKSLSSLRKQESR